MLSRQSLVRVKIRALRQRAWFQTLSRAERAIMDLTIKCVERVRSRVLARTISTIIRKIIETLEEGFMTKAERIGHRIAERLCTLAESWGNKTCSAWKRDTCFATFLGVNALNTQMAT